MNIDKFINNVKKENKKIVLINANCHGIALKSFLEQSNSFSKEYSIYPLPAVHLNEEKCINKLLLDSASVYIHQDIRKNNVISYELSDEAVVPLLSDSCLNITIPNLVGFGKWLYPNLGEIMVEASSKKNLVFRDEILDKAYLQIQGGELDEYITFFNTYQFTKDELEHLYLADMQKLKKREENWDIKVHDFIKNNFRTIPMFVDAGHSSRYLMYEIGRQVLNLLGIKNDVSLDRYWSELGMPTPISESLKRIWEINYKYPMEKRKSYIFPNTEGIHEKQYVQEYVIEYMYWVYGIKL